MGAVPEIMEIAMRLLVIAGCLSSVAAFTRVALTGTPSRSPRRHYSPRLEESPDGETDWAAAMESLRARQRASQATGQDSDTANAPPTPASDEAAPQASADPPAGGFRFDQ